MKPSLYRQRLRIAAIAGLGLLCAQAALAGVSTVSTTNFAFNGTGKPQSYTVPSGANCVTIQAWGTHGYVQASYLATPGASFSIHLSGNNGGDTMVQASNGTVHVAGGTGVCTADGSPFNVSTVADWTSGGPASPGLGKTYDGYVVIKAAYATYTLTVSASPASAGTVSGAGTFPVGTQAAIKEAPWNGYTAGGWGGADGLATATPTAASTTIAMTADRTVVAKFVPAQPVFTSSNAQQTLVVGTPVSFQVSATQSPVFTAASLPAGLTISSQGLITGTPTASGVYSSIVTASNDGVSVQEAGVGATQVVNISSSTLGNNLNVYAGILSLGVNGISTNGFCIDPWHSSAEDQWLAYNFETLSGGPKVADGMGSATALQIEQLWQQYYSNSMSASAAAGLQIAIWDLVSAAIGPQTGDASWFTLNSSNDYGASTMITWVDAHSAAAAANLYAVSGNGQDYVIQASALPQPIAAAAAATQMIPFVVYARPAVASASATIPINQPYAYSVAATNNPTSYNATGLPAGLSINPGTGVISGSPSVRGTFTVTLTAANPGAAGTGTLTLNILQTYTLTITSPSGPNAGTVTGSGVYYAGATAQIQETPAAGFAAQGWSGPDAAAVASPGSASSTIVMSANRTLVAGFNPIAPVLSGGPPQIMLVGRGVSAQVTATPAATTVITVGGLPPGLWSASGSIGGAPTQVGTYTATITGNNNGATASEQAAIAVYPQPALPTVSQTIKQNQPFFYQVGAPGFGTTLTAQNLPAGLTIDPNTGTVSGTPGATGTFTIALAEQNPAASAAGSITLTVTPTYTLTIVNPGGGTTTGSGSYDAGTVVTVSQAAQAGYRSAGWTGSDAANLASAGSASTTVVMNGNYTITADFVQQATLTIAPAQGGTATGGGTFDVGSVQTITATPNSPWTFGAWSGANIADSGAASTTITITGDETIAPSFTANPAATITAPATAYSLSPLTVKSTASAPADNLTLHSIEWLSPDGTWTVSATAASGGEDDRSYGITFPSAGVWTVRAGASTDGGQTWFYSPSQQITVSPGIADYVVETMAVPAANMTDWFNPSPVAQRTYQVQHVNQ